MLKDRNTTIEIMEDGPFIVDNLELLENSRGEQIECKKKIALCRCGASNNKPLCDGTHKKIAFSGKRKTKISLKKGKEYTGKDISIFYNAGLCYHAAKCVVNLPSVFDSKSRPWINPYGSDKQDIINTIRKCPSGALSYKIGETHTREFHEDKKIIIEKNGPYQVRGNIKLAVEEELTPPSVDRYTLCRCGASKNKPYCDGSHVQSGFTDEDN